MLKFFANAPPLRLCLTVQALGPDLCLHLFGGVASERANDIEGVCGAHVGAVALALPLSSLSQSNCEAICPKGSDASAASASLLSVPGHREDLLARQLALLAAHRLQSRVVLVCGIHVDKATPAVIQNLENMAHDLVQEMLAHPTLCPQKEKPCCS